MGQISTYRYLVFFIVLFFSCEKKDSELDFKYQSLFEEAQKEYYNLNIEKSFALFLELTSLANDVSPTTENQRNHLIALNYLGDIYLNAGEKNLAYKEFENALSLAEKLSNVRYQIHARRNMANLEDNPEKKILILEETLRKFDHNHKNKFALDQIKYSKGKVYSQINNFGKAIDIFEKLLEENYQDTIRSDFYKGLGISYRRMGDFNSAKENLNKALSISENISKLDQLTILIEKANVHLLTKEFKEFDILIQQIKPTVDTIQDLFLKKRVNILVLDAYKQTNNTEGKLDVLSELLSLNEKIYKESNASLGSIAVNLKNYELKKEKKAEATENFYLKILLGLSFLMFLSAIFCFVLFHYFYRKKAQLEQEQAYKDLENEKILASMNAYMNGQEEERKQHAAQLHDNLGANLAAVNMHLSLLKKDVPEKKYERISSMLKNVITETRNISHNIMPPLLVNQGVIAAITEKAIEWSYPELQFEVESNIEKVVLDNNLEIALYRGILECMKNTIDKAQASQVKIIFEQLENNSLHITITDNGKGFDVSIIDKGKGGLGINGVKNRIKYFKGNFNIQSEIGKGTTVHIRVPILKMKKTA